MVSPRGGGRNGGDGDGDSDGGLAVGDALYALPLGEFVAARKRLADASKKVGDGAAAQVIKALAKPSLAAWITNQTVRRAPELVQRLLTSTDALASAQRSLGRDDDNHKFQAAMVEQRQVVSDLLDLAQRVVAEMEHPAGAGVLDKVEKNLRWGGVSAEARTAFSCSRLVGDVPPPGFGSLVIGIGKAVPTPAIEQKPRSPDAKNTTADKLSVDDEVSRKRRQREEARVAAEARQEHQRQIASLEQELRRARAQTAEIGRTMQSAEHRRATAASRLHAAESALEAARATFSKAEQAHGEVVAAMSAAEQEQTNLETSLAAAKAQRH